MPGRVGVCEHRAHSNEWAARISCRLAWRLVSFHQTARMKIIFMMQHGVTAGLEAAPSWFGRDVVECARKAELTVIDTHPVLHAIHSEVSPSTSACPSCTTASMAICPRRATS
jgi:hypothetical protein